MEYYKKVLSNYAVFSGRARRKELWMFVLFNIIITIILSIVSQMIGMDGILDGLYGLAVLVPSLAVGARRLHDTGKSAWWLLLCLVPIIGWIILIIFYVLDSQPGANEYGPNPKEIDNGPVSTPPPAPTPTSTPMDTPAATY